MRLDRGRSKPILVALGVCLAFVAGMMFNTISETNAAPPAPKDEKVAIPAPAGVFAMVLLKYEGYVYDPEAKKPVEGVQVTLQGKKTYTATTNTKGVFSFEKVSPGEYNILLKGNPNKGYRPAGAKLVNKFTQWEPPK
jgi:hypothetical protein